MMHDFVALASPFGGSGYPERADAVLHRAHPVRQPHPPDTGRHGAGAFRRRVSGNRCGSGGIRGAVAAAVFGRAHVGDVRRFGAFPVPRAALRAVPGAPCGLRGGVFPKLRLRVVDRAGPKPGPAVGAGVRASPGPDRQTGLRERRRPARVGLSVVGLRPVHSDDDPYARRPPCKAVQAAGGNLIFLCKPSSHKALGEHSNAPSMLIH